ncbi:MAG: MFS transporter [Hyphomicrobiales bacterium]|nr:MFS transporter [Hyphomicrobiales bacterium]
MPAVLAAPIGRDLGLPPAVSFAGLSAALVVSSFMGPRVGRHVDGGGARAALVASNVCFAAGLAALAAARGPWLLAIGWLVMGLGMGLGFYETAFAALTRLYGVGARNLISGVTLIAGFTSTVGWPVTALLNAHFGWRMAILFWAAANLFVALPLNLLLPAQPSIRDDSAGKASSEPDETTDGRDDTRAMVAVGAMFAATSFVSSGLSAIMPNVLTEFGLSTAAAIGLSALVGPAQIAGRLAEMFFLRRFHPVTPARLATLCLPIGVFLLIVGGAAFATPFVVLYALGNGVLTIIRGTLPLAIFGPRGYGRRIGLLAAPSRMSGALAPLLLGLLFESSGTAGLYLVGGLNVAGFLALAFLSGRSRDVR